jgi:hypothetical protein
MSSHKPNHNQTAPSPMPKAEQTAPEPEPVKVLTPAEMQAAMTAKLDAIAAGGRLIDATGKPFPVDDPQILYYNSTRDSDTVAAAVHAPACIEYFSKLAVSKGKPADYDFPNLTFEVNHRKATAYGKVSDLLAAAKLAIAINDMRKTAPVIARKVPKSEATSTTAAAPAPVMTDMTL